MQKIYYDLHIHTALSPCGDDTMTPNNIVNMSMIKELDCIAVTDHNSCGNIAAVMKVAESLKKSYNYDLVVIPGMEMETMEEVHIVCLFPTIEKALEFEKIVKDKMPKIKNKPETFGEQVIFDENDEIIGSEENLLIVASDISLDSAVDMVNSLDGVVIFAHIDRGSFSVLSNLGFIPKDINVDLYEISQAVKDVDKFLSGNEKFIGKPGRIIRSSDAHYLENINETDYFIELPDNIQMNSENIISTLRSM